MAGVALYTSATLPPRAVVLTAPIPPTVVFGGYHIHTTRSDGTQTVDEVADAAAKAGLKFVILTDHGDATRPPDPPSYQHGVLVIDAVEISTSGGHVVALGLDKASPYPLAGDPRSVIEDIHRLGGWAVVAHPDSPKPELKWQAWETDYDGIEWLNADSEWRDESKGRLIASALRATRRGPESIVALFSRPNTTIARLTRNDSGRPVTLGAMDAHGSWPFEKDIVRTVSQGVALDQPLSGQPADDSRRVLSALERGHAFTIIPAIAGPAVLDFTATQAGVTRRPGQRIYSLSEPVTFHAEVPGAPGARFRLLVNNRTVAESNQSEGSKGSLTYEGMPEAGVYRVEVMFDHRELPWLFSNPLYVGEETRHDSVPEPQIDRVAVPPGAAWTVEQSIGSSGEVAGDADGLQFTFGLSADIAKSPYAAAVAEIAGSARLHTIEFIGRADRPTRMSVQLRAPHPDFRDGLRWRRSIYLDETPRSIILSILDFEPPFKGTTRLQDNAHEIRSLLFVVDTVNSAPGTRGTVWISNVALGLRRPTF